MSPPTNCPCTKGKLYKQCCKRYHDGKAAPTALELMKSRYSAYALRLVDYVIATTHADYDGRNPDTKAWRKDLLKFAESTRFDGLTIQEFLDGESNATVTFTAHLRYGAADASFTEKSEFEKVNGRWFYKSGVTQRLIP